jgi:hypothetical protein
MIQSCAGVLADPVVECVIVFSLFLLFFSSSVISLSILSLFSAFLLCRSTRAERS